MISNKLAYIFLPRWVRLIFPKPSGNRIVRQARIFLMKWVKFNYYKVQGGAVDILIYVC